MKYRGKVIAVRGDLQVFYCRHFGRCVSETEQLPLVAPGTACCASCQMSADCRSSLPTEPVGSALADLLADLGVKETCNACQALARQMDVWGVDGCLEKREQILDQMRKRYLEINWWTKIQAGIRAATSGLAMQLDWNDPIPGLFDEAIRRVKAVSVPLAQPVSSEDANDGHTQTE